MSSSEATDTGASSIARLPLPAGETALQPRQTSPFESAWETGTLLGGRSEPGALARFRFPTVADCTTLSGDLSCQQSTCRYHLAHRTRTEHQLAPTRDCSLAVANEGPHTLDEVAAMFGLSKEWIRQIEEQALAKLKGSELLRKHCDARTTPRTRAIHLARVLAASREQHFCTTFDDSLSGDLARLLVRRQLRREFPDTPAKLIDGIIKEALSP